MGKDRKDSMVSEIKTSATKRHNRSRGRGTINQDRAHSDPKWKNIGQGALQLKENKNAKNGGGGNVILRKGKKWESATKNEVIKPVLNPAHTPASEEPAPQSSAA